MEPYEVDVPVLLFVFVRPDTVAKVFAAIKEARPSVLFLVSDGPRSGSPEDKEKIDESRKIVEDVDWECRVYKLYFDANQGVYQMIQKAYDFAFSHVDRCIILEDDMVPAISFFRFCSELLEKYKDDLRINMICGMNHLGVYKEPDTDYFFSEAAAIVGIAIWKRTYDGFYDSSYGKNAYAMKCLKNSAKTHNKFRKYVDEYYQNNTVSGHIGGPEFYLRFVQFTQSRINILPTKNMIKNIGFGSGSVHSQGSLKKMPHTVQKYFNMETYDVEFPLKHPKYVLTDKMYSRKQYRIIANNHPIIAACRRIERIIRRLVYGDSKILFGEALNRYVIPYAVTYKSFVSTKRKIVKYLFKKYYTKVPMDKANKQ